MKKIMYFIFLICGVSTAQLRESITGPQGVHTDVVLIEKDGQIMEQYFNREYTEYTPHLSWSMAKTISGFLIAQASEEYKFSLNDAVSKYIPEFKGTARIIDLLQMSSNINFTEDYFGIPVSSDVVKMLYLDGAEIGASEYVKRLPLRTGTNAGEHFFYSSGDTNLLMEILKKIINNDTTYENYPWKKIFKPLGIEQATFERDQKNVFIGSSYIYMKPRDYLKIGQLIIADGKWNGKQLIPEFYIKLLHTVAPGVEKQALSGSSSTRAYSVHATTNLPIVNRKIKSEYQDLPPDAIVLLGHQGQLLVASPSKKLVILRLATDKGSKFNRNTFFNAVKNRVSGDDKDAPLKEAAVENNSKGSLHLRDLFKVPALIRRYTAKEYCSCRFVVGRSHEACFADIALTMPMMPQINLESKKVTTKFFIGDAAAAEFTGQKFGCRLLN